MVVLCVESVGKINTGYVFGIIPRNISPSIGIMLSKSLFSLVSSLLKKVLM